MHLSLRRRFPQSAVNAEYGGLLQALRHLCVLSRADEGAGLYADCQALIAGCASRFTRWAARPSMRGVGVKLGS